MQGSKNVHLSNWNVGFRIYSDIHSFIRKINPDSESKIKTPMK
ncbi:hypothetical protein B4073_4326 [Bacillus subtilis]|nr:hypothetical protein B4073_4326 [Bacillus subtilis]KIN50150.1 hypothetical protein B4146_1171 [Bacillus subtilis]